MDLQDSRDTGTPQGTLRPLPAGFTGWSPTLAARIRKPRQSPWVSSYARDADIPPLLKRVLCAIAEYANRSGRCFPSLRTIGDKVGLTVKRVHQLVHVAANTGWVKVQWGNPSPNPANRQPNLYQLLIRRQPKPVSEARKHKDASTNQQDREKNYSNFIDAEYLDSPFTGAYLAYGEIEDLPTTGWYQSDLDPDIRLEYADDTCLVCGWKQPYGVESGCPYCGQPFPVFVPGLVQPCR